VKKAWSLLVVVGLCLVAVGALSACGGGSDSGGGGGSEGGTLKAGSVNFPDNLDPQLSYSIEGWTGMFNTYIPLLTYKRAEGEAGAEVVPGLAKAMPEITNGGKTYTMTLQSGLKYSDGTPVKASDFGFAIERIFRLNSPGSSFYTDIVGAAEFAETKQGGIPGIETDDASGKIVINLTKPRGTFLNELALIFAAPVPQDTPAEDTTRNPAPATGPLMITEAKPGRSWAYARNPYWEKANAAKIPEVSSAKVDKIEVEVIRNEATMVEDVERGALNWIFQPPPADRYADVKAKYEGTQFKTEPSLSNFYLWMNTQEAPFDDLEVRQAVNYAVDPAVLERIAVGQLKALQQILPEGIPGFEKFDLYPHDMAKAEAMIAAAKPADMDITVWTIQESPWDEIGEYYEGVLGELGFNTTLKVVSLEGYAVITNTSTPNLDTGWYGLLADYPHPSNFLRQLTAEAIAPTGNVNIARADYPALDAKFDKLGRETLGPTQEQGYAELDEEFMEEAPWVPIGSRTYALFVSSDINLDSVIWTPTFQTDLTTLEFK